MDKRDTLRVNFDQNPAVAEAAQKLVTGDKVNWGILGVVRSIDSTGIDIIVDAVIPEGYEIADEGTPTRPMAPVSSEPVISPDAMMVRRKP